MNKCPLNKTYNNNCKYKYITFTSMCCTYMGNYCCIPFDFNKYSTDKLGNGHVIMNDKILKPCPFCGEDAEIVVNKSKQGQTSNVRCLKCSCRKTLLKHPNYDGDIEQDAINDWNGRI